jgi:hypothetical protein
MSDYTLYYINFTEAGEKVQRWGHYFSYSEALRAIKDADLIIPFSWDYTIDAEAKS